LSIDPLAERLSTFGWKTITADGHDFDAIRQSIHEAKQSSSKPTAIVFITEKGRGVPFMTNNTDWHYKTLSADFYRDALDLLS
jgi:transketolase